MTLLQSYIQLSDHDNASSGWISLFHTTAVPIFVSAVHKWSILALVLQPALTNVIASGNAVDFPVPVGTPHLERSSV